MISGSSTLKCLFNVSSDKQFTTKNIVYAIKCIEFLNNLSYGEQIKELSEWIHESVNILSIVSLIK